MSQVVAWNQNAKILWLQKHNVLFSCGETLILYVPGIGKTSKMMFVTDTCTEQQIAKFCDNSLNVTFKVCTIM